VFLFGCSLKTVSNSKQFAHAFFLRNAGDFVLALPLNLISREASRSVPNRD